MNYLSILALVPQLIELIKSIESVYPNSGQGANKLQLVLDLVLSLNKDLAPLIPQITSVISVLVSFMNKIGLFKSSTPAV